MAFGGGWTLRIGDRTGPDRTVRAARHKIVHVGPTWGCALGVVQTQRRTAVRTSYVTRMTIFAEEAWSCICGHVVI